MKRTAFPVLLLLLAAPLLASGVTYDFSGTTEGTQTMSGTASVDGARSRVELTHGDGLLFKDGSIVLSGDGGRTLRVLDPRAKTYYTLSLDELFASAGTLLRSMGSMFEISFSNEKVAVEHAGPGQPIEGYPTAKYTVVATYDMTATVLGSKMETQVSMKTDIWTTSRLPAAYAVFVQDRGVRTG
ncbi:MAG: hypothetical protein LC732_07275, partial [Acidobacteria bacterium]|nr:hypothetical protein [Acidobacteriota bacterium]